MPQASRTFRVFVSSTFSDLKAERNALQEQVFPRLRELCEAHGCRFQAIDLRWGVSEEAALDQQTMKICLQELRRCQAVSPRPNFIALLGDRYGWRPLPPQILATEYEALQAGLSPTDGERLSAWYRRDDNAVPAEYCLRPRQGAHVDGQTWFGVERELLAILEHARAGRGDCSGGPPGYSPSATEQEILEGALHTPSAREHVFGFFRTITGLPQEASAGEFVDLDVAGRPDASSRSQLESLKQSLRNLLPGQIREYPAAWTGSGITLDHVPQLCEDVYAALSELISQEIARLTEVDPVDRESESHRAFGIERAQRFIGRSSVLLAISAYVAGVKQRPLVIYGPPGCGKSALVAKAVERIQDEWPNEALVIRFIGATPESSDGRALLESICRQIARLYGADPSTIPSAYQELVLELPKRLALATAERPLIVFLDALDQLSDTNNATSLAWLPTALPKHVRMVVSTQAGPCLEQLAKLTPAVDWLELAGMAPTEGASLLDLWLADAGRTLQAAQRERVLAGFAASGLPLYLRLAFDEVCRWKSFDELCALGPDIPSLIRNLLTRLGAESNHGAMLVERSLGYLMSARNGLTEDELIDLLSRDDEVIADFRRRAPRSPHAERLPVVVWSRLYFDLAPYLTERRADGTILLSFYHRQLAEVVAANCLAGSRRSERHAALARYFGGQPLLAGQDGRWLANRRKLSELPYQLTRGELWDELRATLTNLDFVEAKCTAGSIYELLEDYEQASAASGPALQLAWRPIAQALSVNAHLLARSPATTFQTIYNCLVWQESLSPEAQALLQKGRQRKAVMKTPWLRSLCPPPEAKTWLIASQTGDTDWFCHFACWAERGDRVLIGTRDGSLALWIPAKGSLELLPDVHANHICPLTGRDMWRAARPPADVGSWVAVASWDGCVHVVEPSTGALRWQVRAHRDRVTAVAVSPSGSEVASGSWDQRVVLCDAATGRELACWDLGARVTCLAYSAQGELYTGTSDGGLAELTRETRTIQWLRRDLGYVSAVDVDWETDLLCAAGEGTAKEGWVCLWRRAQLYSQAEQPGRWSWFRRPRPVPMQWLWRQSFDEGFIADIRISTATGQVAFASVAGTVYLLNPSTLILQTEAGVHGGSVRSVEFSPDGQTLLTAGHDGTAKILHVKRIGKQHHAFNHSMGVTCVAIDPCGRLGISMAGHNPLPVSIGQTPSQIEAHLEVALRSLDEAASRAVVSWEAHLGLDLATSDDVLMIDGLSPRHDRLQVEMTDILRGHCAVGRDLVVYASEIGLVALMLIGDCASPARTFLLPAGIVRSVLVSPDDRYLILACQQGKHAVLAVCRISGDHRSPVQVLDTAIMSQPFSESPGEALTWVHPDRRQFAVLCDQGSRLDYCLAGGRLLAAEPTASRVYTTSVRLAQSNTIATVERCGRDEVCFSADQRFSSLSFSIAANVLALGDEAGRVWYMHLENEGQDQERNTDYETA